MRVRQVTASSQLYIRLCLSTKSYRKRTAQTFWWHLNFQPCWCGSQKPVCEHRWLKLRMCGYQCGRSTAWWKSVSNICIYTQLNPALIAASWRLCAPVECLLSCLFYHQQPQTQTHGSRSCCLIVIVRNWSQESDILALLKTLSFIWFLHHLNCFPSKVLRPCFQPIIFIIFWY